MDEKELFLEIEQHNRKIIELLEEQAKKQERANQKSEEIREGLKRLEEKKVAFDFPAEISTKVTNHPEVKFPTEFKISNWEEQPNTVKLLKPAWWKDPEKIAFPKSFRVENLNELKLPEPLKEVSLKKPTWWKETDFTDLKDHLSSLFKGFWEATKETTQNVFIKNRLPKEAVPVKLVNTQNEFYNANFEATISGGGGGGTSSSVAVNNNLTLKHKAVDVSSSGNNEIVAAVAGKRIAVYAVRLQAAGTVSFKFKSNDTDLEGASPFQAREGYIETLNPPYFLFATTSGQALNLNLSDAVQVTGRVSYFEI